MRIENAIKLKFGNETAAYKAVGGFLFLRFICPSITVPQYYGLISGTSYLRSSMLFRAGSNFFLRQKSPTRSVNVN